MRKVKVLILVAAVLAAMASTTGTSNAGTDEGGAKPTASVQFLAEAKAVCSAGYICLFTGRDQSGSLLALRAGQYYPDFTKIRCDVLSGCLTNNDFNDEATSWQNNTNMKYCVSWGINGGNPDNTMPALTEGNFTSSWNDEASSIGFGGCP